jgi:hypothetical protein
MNTDTLPKQTAATTPVPDAPAVTVSDEDKLLFDTRGYLLFRGALAQADRKLLLEETLRLAEAEHDDSRWRKLQDPAKPQGQPSKDVQPGFLRLNGLFRMSEVYDRLIDYPTIFPYLKAFVLAPQIVNSWSIIKTLGNDVGQWHRGIDPTQYFVTDGHIRTNMLNTVYFLDENGPDDGCMLALPGSHKSPFSLRWSDYKGMDLPGAIKITGQPGDVLIFSEALLHNGLGNTTGRRRANLYLNYVAKHYNATVFSPQHNFHFAMPPSIRARFTPQRKQASTWMEHVQTVE